MFIKLAIMIYLMLLTSGCGTMKFSHGKIYYRTDIAPSVPITTDRRPTDKVAVVITRDSAMIRFRKEF